MDRAKYVLRKVSIRMFVIAFIIYFVLMQFGFFLPTVWSELGTLLLVCAQPNV